MEKASSNIKLNHPQIAIMAMVVGGSLIASSVMAMPSERRGNGEDRRGGEVKVHRTPERNPNYAPPQRQVAPAPAPVVRETAPPSQNTTRTPETRGQFSQNNRPQSPRDNNGGYRGNDNRGGDNNYRGNNNRGGDNNYRGNDNRGGNYNANPRPQPQQPQFNNRQQPRNPQYNNNHRPDNNYRQEPRRDNDRRRFEFSNRNGNQYWGPNGNWTRWNYSWGDPNLYARRWGFDGYDQRRGWRRGNTWYAYPSLWSNWGGWYSFFLSSGNLGFSYSNGYSSYGGYGDDCMRVQSRDWYRGGRAVMSYVVCENGWGDWREIQGTRQFEYWTY